MHEFELLRNITIGQYIPTGSPVHQLDPRAKLIAGGLLVLTISFCNSILANLLLLGLILGIVMRARIPVSYAVRILRLAIPAMVIVLGLQLLFLGRTATGTVYFEWGWLRITQDSLQVMVVNILRVFNLLILTGLITMTSTTTELTHGLESLLAPLQRFGFPAHEIALIFTIALRFVPTLAQELEMIMKAQASRGGLSMLNLRFWRPDLMAKAYLPLLVPLFVNAMRRAEELINAMEARVYLGGVGRSKFVELQSSPKDYLVVLAALLIFLVNLLLIWLPTSNLFRWLIPFVL